MYVDLERKNQEVEAKSDQIYIYSRFAAFARDII
jgi:hypothetical protein